MGGVFFRGGLCGPLLFINILGLGVLGGVGAGLLLGVDLGVRTNAAGIVTVFSDFWNSFGDEARAAVMTFGSIWPFWTNEAGGWVAGVSFEHTWTQIGKELVECPTRIRSVVNRLLKCFFRITKKSWFDMI